MPSRLLVRLGGHSKQTGNEPGLLPAVAFVHPLYVPLPQHVHDLVALQRAPRGLKREAAQPWLDQSLDAAVVLLHHVVELLDLSPFTPRWHGPSGFELAEGLRIRRVCVAGADARSDGMSSPPVSVEKTVWPPGHRGWGSAEPPGYFLVNRPLDTDTSRSP
jgi:hypothetical protein